MKTYYSLILAFVLAFSVSAQKKQLKAAQKLVSAASYDAAFSSLNENSDLLEAAEPKYVSHYHYLLGVTLQAKKEFLKVVAEFDKVKSIEKEAGLNKYTQLINGNKPRLVADVVNQAVSYNTDKKYKDAGELLYLAYELDDENLDYLYYAASSAVNSGDFEKALPYYLTLKEKNYTGSVTKFYATEVSTGEESEVDQNTYKIYKKSKEFTNLRTGLSESRLPEIVKNIALIYVSNGDNDAAIQAFKEARSISPKDINIILQEIDLYSKIGDEERYNALLEEAISLDPNNPILYFNAGVSSYNRGKMDEMFKYMSRAIELEVSQETAYLLIAEYYIANANELVDEMNSLPFNTSSDKKRDQLKIKKNNLLLKSIPNSEKVLDMNSKNADAIRQLRNVYYSLDDTANFKKYRDMLEAL